MNNGLTVSYLRRKTGWTLSMFLIVVMAIIGLLIMPGQSKAADNLIDVDFEEWAVGGYTESMFEDDWGDIWSHGIDSERVTIVDDGLGSNGKAIKVKYPEGQISSANSGGTWMPNIGEHDEVYLSFKALFPSDFDPVLMGKMHGLCGKDCPAGGSPVTGSNGFSARLAFTTWPNIELYLYHMHMPSVYGEEFQLDFDLVKNEWIAFKMRVKLNDIGLTNGEIQIWANDEEVLYLQNLELRTDPSVKIDTFDFSTFYGGATNEFKPSKDEYIHFDDFKVYVEEDTSCTRLAQPDGIFANCSFTNHANSFTAEFDSTPSANLMDGVVGLSDGTASEYADLAVNLRFNNSGYIDVRNGSSYDADASIAYSANTSYHFRMEVDMMNNNYSVFVTPEGGAEQTLATDYAFRTDQASVTQLNNISHKVNTTFGSLETSNFSVVLAPDTTAPTAPTNLSAPTNNDTWIKLAWTASTDNFGVAGYDIYNGPNLVGSTTSETTFRVTGLTANTAYTFTVKAKDAAENVSEASVALTAATAADCVHFAQADGFYVNCGFTNQTDSFTVEYDSTPSADLIDGLTGISDGPASAFSKMATIIRFNNLGFIDARNGSNYEADASIAYSANTSYHFRIEVDMTDNKYSVYVTPEGGSEQTVATDYAFRTEQASVTQLNNVSYTVNTTFGSIEISNFTVAPSKYGYGGVDYNQADAAMKRAIEVNEARIKNDSAYREAEKARVALVIKERESKGLDISEQVAYQNKLNKAG